MSPYHQDTTRLLFQVRSIFIKGNSLFSFHGFSISSFLADVSLLNDPVIPVPSLYVCAW